MKSYESSAPRITCAIVAMAMTTITIGLLVVLPSMMEPDNQAFVRMATSKSSTSCDSGTPSLAACEQHG